MGRKEYQGVRVFKIQLGDRFDRYSKRIGEKDRGSFVSPVNTPYGDRALPYDQGLMNYTQYEVTKSFAVHAGSVTGWFGMKGGGVQYQTHLSIKELIRKGYIKEVAK